MVRQWRRRWVETSDQSKTVIERLLDSSRLGAPLKFTLEQQVECMALACHDPMEYGLPISHWSAHELASELIKRGIVEQISPRQVGRGFRRSRTQTAPVSLLAFSPRMTRSFQSK